MLTSTSEVYGTAQFVPIDETHPLRGQSPYAATKIGADALGESYHRRLRPARDDPPAVQHVRAAAVGPGDHPDDHQPGADPPGRPARQPGAPARPDVRQGHGRGLRRDRGLRRARSAGSSTSAGARTSRSASWSSGSRIASAGRSASRPTPNGSGPRPARSAGSSRGLLWRAELWGWAPRYSLDQALDETIAWVRDNLALFRVDSYTT